MTVADALLTRAVELLQAGRLVAFPTETVYGLGADAANPVAVGRIFQAKGRPPRHPVIVHLGSAAQLPQWAQRIPPAARQLAEAFWPGPLTLILPRAPGVPDAVTGGQETVGLRVPAHPVALALLQTFGGGIAAPSANRFGRISPTTADAVRAELGDAVDLVLDGGPCSVGIESTIVDCSGEIPALLRPGHIRQEQLEERLGIPIASPSGSSPRASGTLATHYAPLTPLLLVDRNTLLQRIKFTAGRDCGILAFAPPPPEFTEALWIIAPDAPADYARQLYGNLRRLDGSGCRLILVEIPPSAPPWTAVADRLGRAAAGTGPEAP